MRIIEAINGFDEIKRLAGGRAIIDIASFIFQLSHVHGKKTINWG
ncbi:MAG: hypothetical protein NZ901_12240 [Geminocystis sp.]|nr:hypothetical protein [Geminocystis sp.]MCS7148938.1 hypothetical protein [Geminocystis sp.]MCX8077439.1 hypothetical protein [Geminocystis sp.]MDW8117215.1 hypothetical protein [Geminocystis sp.]MDW8462358.1 hypothetical protein [Geminocystis sp.]